MSVNENKMTKEMIQKAIQCKDASELVVLAKAGHTIRRKWSIV